MDMKTSMKSWNVHDAIGTAAFQAMRCDLHVHSARSGAVDVPPFTRVADESYEEPLAVYEQARRRGMDPSSRIQVLARYTPVRLPLHPDPARRRLLTPH